MIYLSIHVPPAAGERLACFYLPPLRGALTGGAKSRLRVRRLHYGPKTAGDKKTRPQKIA